MANKVTATLTDIMLREKDYEETKSLEKLPKIKVNDRVKKKSIDDVDAVKIAKIIQSIHTFTNKFDITTLKPFESKVLVRDTNTDKWRGAFYSHCKSNEKKQPQLML